MYKVVRFNNKLITVAFWQMIQYETLFKGTEEECEDYIKNNS